MAREYLTPPPAPTAPEHDQVAALLGRIVTDGGRWLWWDAGWREHPAMTELRALVQVDASPTLLYGAGHDLDAATVAQILDELAAAGHLRGRAGAGR